jgi:hypothetical protein
MVAVIKFSNSIRNALHYNENKLKLKTAQLIHSANYIKETDRLGFSDKIKHLEQLTMLNDLTKKNSVHISLNFDPSEKLDQTTLQNIADCYMKEIGFGGQPYLVYQHFDAGHPHVHIVTTNIKWNGKRIKSHNIGKNESEKARKKIEQTFGLVRAETHQQKEAYQLKPVNALKVQYGKSETKRAITNVLDAILSSYKYTSLAELNAVLKQYNVIADRGSDHSRIYKNKGLVYRVLDEKGNKVGVPIKASDIYSKPGLKFLEEKFQQNESLRQPHKQHIRNAVDLAFTKRSVKLIEELIKALRKEKIQLVLRQNDEGIIYGLTYIDHERKCVFNGSDLGKPYSANGIQQRFNAEHEFKEQGRHSPERSLKKSENQQNTHVAQARSFNQNEPYIQARPTPAIELSDEGKHVLQNLIQPEYKQEQLPYQLKKQKRKRKRKRLHL